jgi:voltage-gated potassium channel Kch
VSTNLKKNISPTHIWKAEKGLTVLLAFLVFAFFSSYPFIVKPAAKMLVLVCFSFLLITGAFIVFKKRILGSIVTVVVIISLALHWLNFYQCADGLAIWVAFFNFLFCGLFAFIVLILVFREGSITVHRIAGAIVVYMFLGLIWGFLYHLIALLIPDAFKLPHTISTYTADMLQNNLLYFSFETLTTLGYGDILAVHPIARLFVILEALTGQLFPAILIARLVSLQIVHSRDKKRDQ